MNVGDNFSMLMSEFRSFESQRSCQKIANVGDRNSQKIRHQHLLKGELKSLFSKIVMKMVKTVWLNHALVTVGIFLMTCNFLFLAFRLSSSWQSKFDI